MYIESGEMVSDVDSVTIIKIFRIGLSLMVKRIVMLHNAEDQQRLWEVTVTSNITTLVFVQQEDHVQEYW